MVIKQKLIFGYLFVKNYFLISISRQPSILSIDETITQIILHKKSISRFGDGEFMLMFSDQHLNFQEINESLSERLKEVLSSKLDNHIIALPYTFGSLKQYIEPSRLFWMGIMIKYRTLVLKMIDLDYIY
jgi:hypothetical protein